MGDFDIEVDARGLSCPIPVLKLSQELKKLESGQVLFLRTTDPASQRDVNAYLHELPSTLVKHSIHDGVFHYYIQK